MNTEEFLDADFEVIGFTKNSVILLSKEHKTSVTLKMDTVNMLFVKMVCQYGDSEAKNAIKEMISK